MNEIKRYSFGSITVDGQTFENDLIIYPDRIQAGWWRKEGHRLRVEDLSEVLSDPPEILVIGQGASGRMEVDPKVLETLRKSRVQVVAEPTSKACDRFNELQRQGKRVVAALHLTC
ncbi:MAG: Mth938-like domain-containing protein [Candidatus Abyssubacteria bacterium]